MDKFKAEPDTVRKIGEKDFQKKKEQIWHSELSKLQTKLTESQVALEHYQGQATELKDSTQKIEQLEEDLIEVQDRVVEQKEELER